MPDNTQEPNCCCTALMKIIDNKHLRYQLEIASFSKFFLGNIFTLLQIAYVLELNFNGAPIKKI